MIGQAVSNIADFSQCLSLSILLVGDHKTDADQIADRKSNSCAENVIGEAGFYQLGFAVILLYGERSGGTAVVAFQLGTEVQLNFSAGSRLQRIVEIADQTGLLGQGIYRTFRGFKPKDFGYNTLANFIRSVDGIVTRRNSRRTELNWASRSRGAPFWNNAALWALNKGNKIPPNNSHSQAAGMEPTKYKHTKERPPPTNPTYIVTLVFGILARSNMPMAYPTGNDPEKIAYSQYCPPSSPRMNGTPKTIAAPTANCTVAERIVKRTK